MPFLLSRFCQPAPSSQTLKHGSCIFLTRSCASCARRILCLRRVPQKRGSSVLCFQDHTAQCRMRFFFTTPELKRDTTLATPALFSASLTPSHRRQRAAGSARAQPAGHGFGPPSLLGTRSSTSGRRVRGCAPQDEEMMPPPPCRSQAGWLPPPRPGLPGHRPGAAQP